MSVEEQMIENAKEGKVLTHKCTSCSHLHLSTVYYCQKCGSKGFQDEILEGTGSIATYTIITVPPAGFENLAPYAWVVMELDDSEIRVSGFLGKIPTPEDLPIGTPIKIIGFDERGIILEKQ